MRAQTTKHGVTRRLPPSETAGFGDNGAATYPAILCTRPMVTIKALLVDCARRNRSMTFPRQSLPSKRLVPRPLHRKAQLFPSSMIAKAKCPVPHITTLSRKRDGFHVSSANPNKMPGATHFRSSPHMALIPKKKCLVTTPPRPTSRAFKWPPKTFGDPVTTKAKAASDFQKRKCPATKTP